MSTDFSTVSGWPSFSDARDVKTEVPCAWNCIQGKSKIPRHPNKSWNSGGVSVEALRGDSSAQHHRTEVLRAVQTYIFSCGVAYFMDHIHLWHKYNPLGTTIFRSIDQRTQCHTRHSKNFCGRGEGYPNVSRSRSTICSHDDVIKWSIFRVTGPLCEEFTGRRWIPLTKASDAELWWFLWSTPEQTVE